MTAFGLDIGSALIKVAQVKKQADKLHLDHFGWATNPLGMVAYDDEAKQKQLAEIIKKLIKDSQVEGKEVTTCLPGSQVYSRILEMPVLSETELASAINWEAEQYIPVALDEVNLSWQILSRPKVGPTQAKMLVFLLAAPKKLVDNHIKLLEMVGLEPAAIETDTIALARAIPEQAEAQMAIQIGWQTTDIVITEQNDLVFTYSINTGCEALTRSISDELKLDFYQAEEYRRTYGFEKQALEGKVAAAMQLVFDQLAGESRRALDFYQSKSEGKTVSRIILAGGGALTPAINVQLTEILGVEVSLTNPLSTLTPAKNQAWPKELLAVSPLMVQAISLASREL